MQSSTKVKFILFLATVLLLGFIALISFQLIKINKANKELESKNYEISQLEQQLKYYENLQDSEYNNNIITD